MTWQLDPQTKAERLAEFKAELRIYDKHCNQVIARRNELRAIVKSFEGRA